MMRKILIILILLFYKGMTLWAHPIHVSVCNLEFDKGDLTVSVKLFWDDLQLAVYHNTGKQIESLELTPESNTIIQNYIKKNLQISLNNNNKLELNESGNEISESGNKINDDAIWLYYKMDNIPEVTNIHILNTLLLDIYSDQTNLLIINHMGNQNGYRFHVKSWERNIKLK